MRFRMPEEGGRRLIRFVVMAATIPADAVGYLLVADFFVCMLPGRSSLSIVLFSFPGGGPVPILLTGLLGIGILSRHRFLMTTALLLAIVNMLEVAFLLAAGRVNGPVVTLSMAVTLLLAWGLRFGRIPSLSIRLSGSTVALGAMLMMHIFTFGTTDYRRPADAIVVFGAKAYSVERPSLALADRVRTGIELFRQGYAPVLVFSGGDEEPMAMRWMALQTGVPDAAIELDETGLNTEATLRYLQKRGGRILAVSHYYHGPRIKLTANRFGLDCHTVPAKMTRRLAREPWFLFRECVAFVAYYLRGVSRN